MRVGVVQLREQARELTEFVRQVTAILNGGLRLADQLGGVRAFRWGSTATPVLVAYQGVVPPLAVLCLRVIEARGEQGRATSGVAVEWTHSTRGLLVSAIGGTTPGTEYDVTVLIVEG